MSASSARRGAVRARPVVGLAVGLAVLLGCAGDPEVEQASPDPTPSTVAELDAGGIEVPRLDFCELVPEEAVTAALGALPQESTARGPGEPDGEGAPLQEVGCAWGVDGATAAAWLFAEPVDTAQARRLVEESGTRPGCETDDAAYGAPGVRQVCTGEDSGPDGPRVRYAGLLGDTWLTCELRGPGAAERAEAWCVALLTALDPRA